MSQRHAPQSIPTGTLPGPGGSVRYPEKEAFPTFVEIHFKPAWMLDVSLKGCTSKPRSQERGWEREQALDRGGQEPAGHGSKARSCARGHMWYLEATVDLLEAQGVADPWDDQLHHVAQALPHVAQRLHTGGDVLVAKEGDGHLPALSWLQDT